MVTIKRRNLRFSICIYGLSVADTRLSEKRIISSIKSSCEYLIAGSTSQASSSS
jgi:hypothetical protein